MTVTTPEFDLPRIAQRREQLPSEIARTLLEYIFSGKIQPGTRLPSERQFAEMFGTGRSAVREALKSLGLLGLLEVRQGDGTYLRGADSELLPRVIEWGLLLGEQRASDLVEARQHIEIITTRLAAERRTDTDIRDLQRILNLMQRSRSTDAFVKHDVAFHLRVAEASGNTVLSNMLGSIQSLLHVWIRRVIAAAGETAPSYDEHVPVFEAIKNQDPEAAVAAMSEHLEAASARLRNALEEAQKELDPHQDGNEPLAPAS